MNYADMTRKELLEDITYLDGCVEQLKEQVKFLQATIKAQADLLDKYQGSAPTTIKEGEA